MISCDAQSLNDWSKTSVTEYPILHLALAPLRSYCHYRRHPMRNPSLGSLPINHMSTRNEDTPNQYRLQAPPSPLKNDHQKVCDTEQNSQMIHGMDLRILTILPDLVHKQLHLLRGVVEDAREQRQEEAFEPFHVLQIVPGADFFLLRAKGRQQVGSCANP